MSLFPAASAYADWFVGVLSDAVADERATAYRERLADCTPEPVTVRRYRCPHCGTSRAKEAAAKAHMARCWHNPAVHACKSCIHFEPYVPARSCWGDPYCNCPEVPEGCAIGAWPDGTPFPVTDCPQWEATP